MPINPYPLGFFQSSKCGLSLLKDNILNSYACDIITWHKPVCNVYVLNNPKQWIICSRCLFSRKTKNPYLFPDFCWDVLHKKKIWNTVKIFFIYEILLKIPEFSRDRKSYFQYLCLKWDVRAETQSDFNFYFYDNWKDYLLKGSFKEDLD